MFQGFVRERLSHTRELHDKFAFAYALVPLAAAAILKGDTGGRRGFWALVTRLPNV